MKKILLFLSVPVLMVACKSNPSVETKTPAIDTTGLAAFQQFKAINEQKAFAMYYSQNAEPAAAKTVIYHKQAAQKKQRLIY